MERFKTTTFLLLTLIVISLSPTISYAEKGRLPSKKKYLCGLLDKVDEIIFDTNLSPCTKDQLLKIGVISAIKESDRQAFQDFCPKGKLSPLLVESSKTGSCKVTIQCCANQPIDSFPEDCDKLADNDALQCILELYSKNPQRNLTRSDYESCGCIFMKRGSDTEMGERDIFKCPGDPEVRVNDFPGKPGTGVTSNDPPCIFDILPNVHTGVDIEGPEDKEESCYECHDPDRPYMISDTAKDSSSTNTSDESSLQTYIGDTFKDNDPKADTPTEY